MKIITKIITIIIILFTASTATAFNDSFDYNYPDCDAPQCKDPRIKPTPEVPPNPKCVHWWCNPEIPKSDISPTENNNVQKHTFTTNMFIFGKSDVDRYKIFKSQINDSKLSKRAKYFIDIILWDYDLTQTEFENKFGLI